jgi:glycosyltransferase involved in cell wall biosynthesis
VLLWQRAERAAIGRHRYIVASSPVVAAAIREVAPRSRVVVAPMSLDPAYYRAAPLDGPPVAGIIGTAGWPPTRAAIERLATRVWPAVRRLAPDARLIVAGRGTDRIPGLAGVPGLEVAGSVDSAADWLAKLSLLLFPLERGSGMKVKVLEALATGLPVVTTAAGSEGIDAGEGAVVGEDDEALARAAARILLDPGERRERGAAARTAFEQRYAPEPATRPLVELYEEMAGEAVRNGRAGS